MNSRSILRFLLACLITCPAYAVTFKPLAQISALGGQYFTGSTSSNGTNVDASLVPTLGITPHFYLIPIYLGSYHETQSIYEFLGQNTLIQRQLDQTFVLRSAWAASSNWRLKPRFGYKQSWVKETNDDSLWNGLFKNNRLLGGISAERVLANGTLEIGYEYSRVRYPNYQALDADPRLTTTGITANAGTDVLDFNTHQGSLLYQIASSDRRWGFFSNFSWTREDFVDQSVITTDDSGFESFAETPRTDDIFTLALQENFRPSQRWTFGLSENIQYYLSNQNGFDATQLFATPYTYRYYNFFDIQFNPSLTWTSDSSRWDMTLTGNGGYRKYSHRRAQDSSGNYESHLIYSLNRGGTLTFRYRIVRGLHAVLTGNILTYSSNTRYEANYPYNYTVASYLGGLSWEY